VKTIAGITSVANPRNTANEVDTAPSIARSAPRRTSVPQVKLIVTAISISTIETAGPRIPL
jgi:hypothetical protein